MDYRRIALSKEGVFGAWGCRTKRRNYPMRRGRRRYALGRPRLFHVDRPGCGRDVGFAESGFRPTIMRPRGRIAVAQCLFLTLTGFNPRLRKSVARP